MQRYEGEITTTKHCPVCGNTQLVEISRSDMKICVDHKEFIVIPWEVTEGQSYKT